MILRYAVIEDVQHVAGGKSRPLAGQTQGRKKWSTELDGKDWSDVELVAHRPPGPRSINDWRTGRAIVFTGKHCCRTRTPCGSRATRARTRRCEGAAGDLLGCRSSPLEQCPAISAYVSLSYRAVLWQGKERVLHLERQVVHLKHRVVRNVCDVGVRKVLGFSEIVSGGVLGIDVDELPRVLSPAPAVRNLSLRSIVISSFS